MLFAAIAFATLAAAQQPPNTGVTCSPNIRPQNVPLGTGAASLAGTWYTIAVPIGSTTPSINVCTQVVIQPQNPTDPSTTYDYIGSLNNAMQPRGNNTQAFGTLTPNNLDTGVPLFRLDLDLGFMIATSDFYVLATAGSSPGDISAMVTYSCGIPTDTNTQLFFLSRKPYLVPPVTFDSLSQLANRAIDNFADFGPLQQVPQQEGWCDYKYARTYNAPSLVAVDPIRVDTVLSGEVALAPSTDLSWIAVWVIAAALLILMGKSLLCKRGGRDMRDTMLT